MKNKQNLIDKISDFSNKTSNNKIIKGISRGVMSVLPIIIIGSFANLFIGLPIGQWTAFIEETGMKQALQMIVNGTSSFLALYVAYSTAKCFAIEYEVKEKMIGVFAIVFYMGLVPYNILEGGSFAIVTNYTGSQGMLLGMVVGFITVRIYKFVTDRNIVIKMPEGTPDYVSKSFAGLIPALILAITSFTISMCFSFTTWGNANDCVYGLLQAPLTNFIGGNIWAVVLMTILGQLVTCFGIHAGFLASIVAPFLFALDGANQAAYAAGNQLPNVIGMSFNYSLGNAVFCPSFAIAVLIVAKSKHFKTVGKISLLPSVFAISEPITFGYPVVFNPLLMIPWVFIPCLNIIIGYILITSGIVPAYAGVLVFNFPLGFTGIINGSVLIAIMEIGLLIMDVIIAIPFIKKQDVNLLKGE